MPVLEWVNTSTLSELFSAVNKLSRLFNITCNSFAVSDNNIDYMTSATDGYFASSLIITSFSFMSSFVNLVSSQPCFFLQFCTYLFFTAHTLDGSIVISTVYMNLLSL